MLDWQRAAWASSSNPAYSIEDQASIKPRPSTSAAIPKGESRYAASSEVPMAVSPDSSISR